MSGTTLRISVLIMSGITLAGPARLVGQERSIHISTLVEATPAALYRMFATSDGVRLLFPGADADIGDTVGGPYVVAFDPAGSPDGTENGTAGCVILRLDRDQGLAFEWRGPPWATEMNVEPFPTWVEVTFAPADGAQTVVDLVHHGFGRTEGWDRAYAFFDAAWRRALTGLQQRFAHSSP